MKKIKFLFAVGFLSIQFAIAQDKALYIDQNGNVGINTETPQATLDVNGSMKISGDVNGVKFFKFNQSQSPFKMTGFGANYSTMTISYHSWCQCPGMSVVLLYDISNKEFKIISQGGSCGNNVKVSSSSKTSLVFTDGCGTTGTLSFISSENNVTATVTMNPPGALSEFSILSQGF